MRFFTFSPFLKKSFTNQAELFLIIMRYWICKMVSLACIMKFNNGLLCMNDHDSCRFLFSFLKSFLIKIIFRPKFFSYPNICLPKKYWYTEKDCWYKLNCLVSIVYFPCIVFYGASLERNFKSFKFLIQVLRKL